MVPCASIVTLCVTNIRILNRVVKIVRDGMPGVNEYLVTACIWGLQPRRRIHRAVEFRNFLFTDKTFAVEIVDLEEQPCFPHIRT